MHRALVAQGRNQPEATGQRTNDGARCVPTVYPGAGARCIRNAAGQYAHGQRISHANRYRERQEHREAEQRTLQR